MGLWRILSVTSEDVDLVSTKCSINSKKVLQSIT